jgi:hypothetical protein
MDVCKGGAQENKMYSNTITVCVPALWAPRHEGVLGEWRYSSTNLDLGTRLWWVVSFTPRPLYLQEKSPRYSLDRRLGGPQKLLDAVVKRNIPSPWRDTNPRSVNYMWSAQNATIRIWARFLRFGFTCLMCTRPVNYKLNQTDHKRNEANIGMFRNSVSGCLNNIKIYDRSKRFLFKLI